MRAVILVGGEGTRLRPLTYTVPKPVVPVANRPFLQHMLARLRASGVDRAVLALCYLPDRVEARLGDGGGLGIDIRYVLEERPLGTAGAVRNARGLLEDQTVAVLNGDIFTDLDLQGMLGYHRSMNAVVTLFLIPVQNPSAYGVVETNDEGLVTRFLEKPSPEETSSRWVNGGVYVLEPHVLDLVPDGTPYMFEKGLFPALVAGGYRVAGYRARPYWLDVGNPGAYLQVHRDILRGVATSPLLERSPGDGVVFEGESQVDPSARLSGPLIIGPGCRLGPRATVRGPSVLGPGVEVGDGASLEESVVWEGASIGAGARVRGSIVADGARLQENTTLEEGTVVPTGSTVGPGNPEGTASGQGA